MSRDEGFAVMDVSTSICDDPKFRRIARERPDLVGTVVTAYVATMAESWRVGRRTNVEDAWPAILPYVAEAVELMIAAGLLDRRGVLSSKAWRGWFEPARDRRDKSRADWRKWQAEHRRNKGGVSADSDPDKGKPSDPPVRPSDPPGPPSRQPRAPRGAKDDGLTTPPTKEEALHELSERFKRHEIDVVAYQKAREELSA